MTAYDTYLVFDANDRFHSGAICHGSEEAKDFIAGIKDTRSLRVLRVTLDEMCRDVTEQFNPEEIDDPEEVDGRMTTWARHVKSFSRPSGY
jgi:hypothetical protein